MGWYPCCCEAEESSSSQTQPGIPCQNCASNYREWDIDLTGLNWSDVYPLGSPCRVNCINYRRVVRTDLNQFPSLPPIPPECVCWWGATVARDWPPWCGTYTVWDCFISLCLGNYSEQGIAFRLSIRVRVWVGSLLVPAETCELIYQSGGRPIGTVDCQDNFLHEGQLILSLVSVNGLAPRAPCAICTNAPPQIIAYPVPEESTESYSSSTSSSESTSASASSNTSSSSWSTSSSSSSVLG